MDPPSSTEMPVIVDDFDLDRCFMDEAHSTRIDNCEAESWSSLPEILPQPQKFPAQRKQSHAILDCTSRKIVANNKAASRRAVGVMINLEEAALWSCSDEDIRSSACHTADLMMHYL
jgi:hypothetical protein